MVELVKTRVLLKTPQGCQNCNIFYVLCGGSQRLLDPLLGTTELQCKGDRTLDEQRSDASGSIHLNALHCRVVICKLVFASLTQIQTSCLNLNVSL